MELKETPISSRQLLENFQRLKGKLRRSLPSDIINYQCKNCDLDLPLNSEGVLKILSPVEKDLDIIINEMVECLKERHVKEQVLCSNMICVHPLGTPENIIVSFPESDQVHMKDVNIADDTYKLKLMIVPEKSDKKTIFVLYQKEGCTEEEYLKFIECNFNTHLDGKDICYEELIYDDESATYYQQDTPRLSGGGRRLNADFNYECLWCPKDVIKLGKKGRFKQFKSYREHFKEYHHGEEGNGVSMADFLSRVHRIDPTWYCKNCDRHYSLGNVVYHKSICKQSNQDVSDSERESEDIESVAGPSNADSNVGRKKRASFKKKRFIIYSDSSSDEKEQEENEDTNKNNNDTAAPDLMETNSTDNLNKRSILDNSFSEENNDTSRIKTKKKVKKINTDYTFLDVNDELYSSSPEMDLTEAILEPKVEVSETPEFEIEINVEPSKSISMETFKKWWLNIPKHLYGDKGLGGPAIFLSSDSEEFVKRCTDRYKKHIQEKRVLDINMQEAESEEAQSLQFSLERDKPILEQYTAFVQTSSAKDVLNFFSEEYEQYEIPSGAKSSTAGQYTNRIMEFFKFMSKIYHNFHLDWMVDFKGAIEKDYKDGSKSSDIFIPPKEDFTEFIKQFKYGGKILF